MNNQKGFANIVLILVVVVLVGAVGYSTLVKKPLPSIAPSESNNTGPTPSANNNPSQQTTSPHLNIGENVIITGSVIKNDTSCIVDAYCSLKLNTDRGEINILYNPGRSTTPCINAVITDKTLKIKSGDKVEVYGKVISEDSISTCDSKEFYIKA